MTTRERKSLGSAPASAVTSEAAHANGRHGAEAVGSRALCWQEWFACASSAQRATILALAARQGFVFANQIPPLAHGSKNRPKPEDAAPAPTWSRLFAGQIADLGPVVAQPVTELDGQLDAAQREAVARATATPDVFLLQGLPGTGRSRVVAEILHQAAVRGQRVLFLANHAAPVDVVLRRLLQNPAILALRFLAPGESAETLPAELVPLMPAERQRLLREQAKRKTQEALTEAQRRCTRRKAEEECWPALANLADQIDGIQRRIQEGTERLSRVADEVNCQVAAGTLGEPGAGALTRLVRAQAQQLTALNDDHMALDVQARAPAAECWDLDQAIHALAPLAEAKRAGRWWTRAWWKATLRGRVSVKMAELQNRRQTLDTVVQALDHSRREIEDKCRQLDDGFQAAKAELLREECERRRQEEARQIALSQQELERLQEYWRTRASALEIPAHRPAEPTRSAIETAKTSWERQVRLDADACRFAERWSQYLTNDGAQLGARLSEWANVLAGTTAAWARDAIFTEAARTPFDLLVLEGADRFTEAEIIDLSRHAPRCVLVAETQGLPGDPVSVLPSAAPSSTSRACGFQKLWQELRGPSHRMAYGWSWEGDRLCSTLRTFSAQDRCHLEIERLADYPEIELRILSMPKAAPLVAQVVFPKGMTIKDAKQFIYRELEEVAIEGWCAGTWLAEDADCVTLYWGPSPSRELECLELEPGVREWLLPGAAQTHRFEFERAAGWSRPRVDQWLGRYLQMRDLGRTMTLRVPYRMSAGLAEPLNEILFAGAYLAHALPDGTAALEIVAVPPFRAAVEPRKRSPGTNGSSPLPREGAGLEQDLGLPRGGDRIPADLRGVLPRRGYANYPEAQAVIRRLEELLEEADDGREPVAVISLYEGQVELLRRLADRSESLRGKKYCVVFGVPDTLKEHEWPIVLVSLTRSNSHRAVPLGEQPSQLVHALTRARRRLIVFGDPGTLVKRSHWQGPLEHLDAVASAQEARRVTALLRRLGLTSHGSAR